MGGPIFLFQSSFAELLQRTPAGKPSIQFSCVAHRVPKCTLEIEHHTVPIVMVYRLVGHD
jgi:hypothetical protein